MAIVFSQGGHLCRAGHAARSIRANLVADGSIRYLRELTAACGRAERGELAEVEEAVGVRIKAAEDRVRLVP